MQESFFQNRDRNNTDKISKYIENLPDFCLNYFIEMENYTSSLTRMNYAMDLRIFFDFISKNKFGFSANQITLQHMNKITSNDISSYISYLSYYRFNGKNFHNTEKGKSRKLASVRSFFKYLFNRDLISSNVAAKIATPKIHTKEIVRLEVDEVSKLISQAENPNNLTKTQQGFNRHTSKRDVAMLTLFLGTGIRVSECVGLNIDDIDFENNAFKITRKGGNQTILYFSDEVKKALLNWLEERKTKNVQNEKALFISLQNRRISVRAVEKLVKKYARAVTPIKKISPHKLRSTYGTNLYRETGDIYIVADVLGHKDVNTTKKHYAAISEDMRRNIADKVKLRD